MGLTVESVTVKAHSGTIQTDPFSWSLVQPGDAKVVVRQEAIEAMLEEQRPGGLRDFRVICLEGKLLVEASAKVIVDIRAKAVCSLRIVDGRQLWVDVDEVDVLGGAATKLVEGQLAKVNPILDLTDLPVKLLIQQVEIGDGTVRLLGTVAPQSS